MKKLIVTLSVLSFYTGCNPNLKNLSVADRLNLVPETFENPFQTPQNSNHSQRKTLEEENTETKAAAPPPQKPTQAAPPKKSTKPNSEPTQSGLPTSSKPTEAIPPHVSKVVYYAQKIMDEKTMQKLGSIGTACNYYVHRILKEAGFPYDIYLADDFDIFAKKYFKHYRSVEFKIFNNTSEVERLKRHIWSYPERTAFIMQWSSPPPVKNGHIAIVERIGEKLVIYQASYGSRFPNKYQTSPNILLNEYNRRELSVYSEFEN